MGLVRDGKGEHFTLDAPAGSLAAYDSIEVETFSIDYPLTPATLTGMLRPMLVQELREKGHPAGVAGTRTLAVRGRIIYYQDSRGVDNIWGPLEEAVAIVELVDKSSGSAVARAACVGRTNASVSRGVESKADGLSEAVANWIDKHRRQ
jgi:hypothetical protein